MGRPRNKVSNPPCQVTRRCQVKYPNRYRLRTQPQHIHPCPKKGKTKNDWDNGRNKTPHSAPPTRIGPRRRCVVEGRRLKFRPLPLRLSSGGRNDQAGMGARTGFQMDQCRSPPSTQHGDVVVCLLVVGVETSVGRIVVFVR